LTEVQRATIRGIVIGVVTVLATQFALSVIGGLLFFGAITKAITALSNPGPTKPSQVASVPASVPTSNGTPITAPPKTRPSDDEMLKAVAISVVEKGWKPSDFQSGQIMDYITIRVTATNTGRKDIRAIRGVLHFQDLFGREIQSIEHTYEKGLRVGTNVTDQNYYRYNELMEKDIKFRTTSLSDMKVLWEPTTILFADGTKLGE